VKITGSVTVPHPVPAVWDAILDPAVLVRTIPGCSRLETVGENAYAMTVTAGVAAIKGTYDGTAVLSDLVAGKSLVMRLTGAGAPGTIDATVQVGLETVEGGTEVSYDADAVVGGMVGGVGQRMLTSVSKRMAGEFFKGIGGAISGTSQGLDTPAPGGSGHSTGEEVGGRAASASERTETRAPIGAVFSPPAKQGDDFVRGIAVGAGLVLLGVVAGRLFGRR
jgi:carbon monoxide dehydrogenase subunit G